MTGPVTRRDDVVDVLHGVEVPDPFRWLEDGTSAETRAWVRHQNATTRAALDAVPARARYRDRLAALVRAATCAAPSLRGTTLFSLDRWGAHDRAVLVRRDATRPGDAADVLLDPADVAGEATAAVDWYAPSPDGALVAVGTSTGGDERSTLRVLDVASGRLLEDRIPHTRAASVAWRPDAGGFAYTRYPDPAEVGPDEAGYHRTVWWHELGADPALDAPLFTDLPDPTAWPSVSLSPDGRFALVHVELGWSRTDVHLLDVAAGAWRTVIEGVEATSWFHFDGDRLLGTTTLDAPRGRVVAVPLHEPHPAAWVEVVPHGEDVIDGIALVGGDLLVASSLAAVGRLARYDRADPAAGGAPIELPTLGSITGLAADPSGAGEVAAIGFTSFGQPDTVLLWQPDRSPEAVATPGAPPLPALRVTQETYASDDGTQVPLLLVTSADDGAGGPPGEAGRPTLLVGYGGFAISSSPAWSPLVAAWCERGGQVAVAGIRGGAEHGEEWHRAGMREHKPNAFADFEAAADHLVATGRTRREQLAIRGGSNGGLLVGACTTRRPDLCRAVVCEVPLLDMIRYPRFLIARLWVPEYGDPDVAEEFGWLWGYSPYHRVQDDTCYPATLITTGEEDSRVDPGHARKFAARLQEATACAGERPVLLRVEEAAGHGQGKPASKQTEERADVLAFLAWQLDPDRTSVGHAGD